MSTPEQQLPGAPDGQAAESRRRGRFLGGWLPALVVVAVVGGLAAVLLTGINGSSGPTQGVGGGSANTSGWQTYHDPMNMYSLRLPPGWTAQVNTGSGTAGDRTGSMTVTTESVGLSDPSQGDASAKVYITAEPITSDFARHWYCGAFQANQQNSSFHGIPAQHIVDATWLFSSANAHFQLDVWIPGVLEPLHSGSPIPQPTATPLPAS